MPDPDGPARAVNSPRPTVRLTSRTACTSSASWWKIFQTPSVLTAAVSVSLMESLAIAGLTRRTSSLELRHTGAAAGRAGGGA